MKLQLKYFGIVIVFILSLTFISCSSDDSPTIPPDEPRTANDVREDFSNLVINDGENDLELESLIKGVYWKFRIIKPESASEANKRPLIIDLHGGALNYIPDAHKVTSCLVFPAFENLEPYVIRPNSNGDLWYDELNQVQILALLDMATEFLDVDSSKVIVTGFSDGGNGSFFYAQYYSDLFSAAIPMATSYDSEESSGFHNFAIPIYAIHGEDDQLFDLSTTQGFIDGAIDAGSDITFIIAPGLNHFSGCDYAPYLDPIEDWLLNSVWD